MEELEKPLDKTTENKSGPTYRYSPLARIIILLLVTLAAILTTLGVLPLARLMNVNPSMLQGAGFQPTFKVMVIGISYSLSQFVIIWMVMRFIHRRSFLSLGFTRPFWKPFLGGTAIGIGMAITEIGTNCLIGGDVSIAWNVPAGTPFMTVAAYFLLWVLFLLTLNSLKEELVFRTYPIELFNDKPNATSWVILFISLIFAAVHHVIEPFTLSAFLSRFSIALVFGYAYYRWRNIWLIVGIHNGTNFVGFLLGAHWKSGGLLSLDYSSPSSGVTIVVDLAVKLTALALLIYFWRKQEIKKIS